jgi:outer membrane protein assembly factor BamB
MPGGTGGAGGAADWPMFRGDAAQTGVAAGSLAAELTLIWSFEAGGAITSSPVVADGRVYVGSDDYSLYALDLESGAKLWSYATQDMIEAPPLWHAGRVYVGSGDFSLYALDALQGTLVWKQETDDKILGGASPVLGPDGEQRIVVGSYDTHLYCFDARTGEERWRYKTDNYVNGTPAILGEAIVFGGCDAALHVVSAASGERLGFVEVGEGCHIAGSVALAGGRAYFGHYGNGFACIDLEKGELVWEFTSQDQPFFSSPAIGADRVVFGGRDKALHCVARDSGKELWSFPTRRKVDGSPVLCDGKVVFGSGDGWLYLVDASDGKQLWSYEIGRSIFSSPAGAGGRVLVGAHDGRLYCFGPKPAQDAPPGGTR